MGIELDVERGMIGAAIDAIEAYPVPQIAALPISAPGRIFTIPDDQRYFEIVLIKNDGLLSQPRLWVGSNPTWGDDELFRGILRIILHWKNDDRGDYGKKEILETMKYDSFPKSTIIRYGAARLEIYNHPSIGDPVRTGHESLYPLTVPYSCFHMPA